MGCVSSTLLSHDDDFTQIGGSNAFAHHIVSLTSTTYGLLTLDPPPPSFSSSADHPSPSPTASSTTTIPPTPPPRFTLGSLFPSPLSSDPRALKPEIINSWELMAGLDSTPFIDRSFRFSPLPASLPKKNSNPNLPFTKFDYPTKLSTDLVQAPRNSSAVSKCSSCLDEFEKLCPPNGENKVVIYTTTLRGIRKTFEACNAVRSAIEALGVLICERDVSMDRGFRDELTQLMKGKATSETVPPRLFVKGRYIGGVEEVVRIVEEGTLGDLLQGLPKMRNGYVCEGCGGVRFLPCFHCNGSCKMVMTVEEDEMGLKQGTTVVVRCSECNENGLVLCPICS